MIISNLIGQSFNERAQELNQEAQEVGQDLQSWGFILQHPDADPQLKMGAKQKLLDLVEEHGGKEAQQNIPALGQYLAQLAAPSIMQGMQKKQARAQALAQVVAQARDATADQTETRPADTGAPSLATLANLPRQTPTPSALTLPALAGMPAAAAPTTAADATAADTTAAPSVPWWQRSDVQADPTLGTDQYVERSVGPYARLERRAPGEAAAEPATPRSLTGGAPAQPWSIPQLPPPEPPHGFKRRLGSILQALAGGVNYRPPEEMARLQINAQLMQRGMEQRMRLGEVEQARAQNWLTDEQANEARRYIITGERLTGQAGTTEDYMVPVNPTTGETLAPVLRDKRTGMVTDATNREPFTVPEGYILQKPSTYRPPSATGTLANLTLAYRRVTDPQASEPDRKAAQIYIDQHSGPSGTVGQIYRALKMQNPNLPDEQVRQMAADRYFAETGLRLNNMLLNMQINSYLSGQPIPQQFGAPAPGGGTTQQAAPTPGGGGTTTETPSTTTPEKPPPAAGGGLKEMTPDERRMVDLAMKNIAATGSATGGGRGAAAAGALRGQEIIAARMKALGLPSDPVSMAEEIKTFQSNMKSLDDLQQKGNAFMAVNERIKYFAANFEELARRVNNVSGRWLNTPWRDIKLGVVGDPLVDQYLMALNAVDRMYTTLTSSPTSNAMLPEGAREDIQRLLPPGMTLKEALGIPKQLHAEAQADVNGFKDALQNIRNAANTSPIGQALGAPQTAGGGGGGTGGGGGGTTAPPKNADEYLKSIGRQ